METDRNIVEELKHDEQIKQAYDIMLALCREYFIEMTQYQVSEDKYLQKIRQLKNDIKLLDKSELILKVNSLYAPLLKKLEQKHSSLQK